jgi:hypothetical protein
MRLKILSKIKENSRKNILKTIGIYFAVVFFSQKTEKFLRNAPLNLALTDKFRECRNRVGR